MKILFRTNGQSGPPTLPCLFFLLLRSFPGEILNGEGTRWVSLQGLEVVVDVAKIWRSAHCKHEDRPLSQVPVFRIEQTQDDVRSLEQHLSNQNPIRGTSRKQHPQAISNIIIIGGTHRSPNVRCRATFDIIGNSVMQLNANHASSASFRGV